jgi:ATP-dependent exoDNAse (exonuclease V) alpha subunit
MIAAHRNEVRDLNERVHELVDAAGQLGATRLVVGRLEFAEGDRVMAVGRNHYDLEILNGDLGTVTHIDPHTRTVTFVCDRDGHSRVMPAAPIEAGNLDYGYARTNHQAQGATVDRTFTLGDDGDLDRQAAYTALSRGRLENRLYVLQPDNDLLPTRPTPREPVRSHVEHELSRDRSQRLASDHLNQNPELPTELRSPPAVPDSSHDVGIDLW